MEYVPRSVYSEEENHADEVKEEPTSFVSKHDGRISIQCDVNTFFVYAYLEDKRNIADISQQEMKNVVCIVLKDKGVLSKDMLIKETTKEMGYGRAGAAIVEGIERGIKYGRKTGEIIVEESNKYRLGR